MPVVAIGTVTVPGATLFDWLVMAWPMERKTLTGKAVPLNWANACGPVLLPPVMVPPVLALVIVFDGLVSMRKRPSPCVPLDAVGAMVTAVDPLLHPAEQVPLNTAESS